MLLKVTFMFDNHHHSLIPLNNIYRIYNTTYNGKNCSVLVLKEEPGKGFKEEILIEETLEEIERMVEKK